MVAGPREDASPLTQRDPPLRSVIQTRAQWSPQYVRSRCIGPRARRTCRHAGEEWRRRLRQEAQADFRSEPTDLQQCLDAMTVSSLLPEHVRDGRGSLGECRGIDFRGRGFGCQTLDKRRIAAHSAGPTTAQRHSNQGAVVPPIRSLTMHRPAGPSYMPTCGGRVA